MICLLDSDICIAAMKKDMQVMERLNRFSLGEVGLPSIVLAELAFGAAKSQHTALALKKLALFTERFPVVPLDFRAAHHYGRIKAQLELAGTPIGSNDYLIAATALAQDAILATRNVREFSRVPGLRWESF
jgi:tRNA(fMet)-specific endonuclease VapC